MRVRVSAGTGAGQPKNARGLPVPITIYDESPPWLSPLSRALVSRCTASEMYKGCHFYVRGLLSWENLSSRPFPGCPTCASGKSIRGTFVDGLHPTHRLRG